MIRQAVDAPAQDFRTGWTGGGARAFVPGIPAGWLKGGEE